MSADKIVVAEEVYRMAKECKNPEQAREMRDFMAQLGSDGSMPAYYPERTVGDESIPVEELAVVETASAEEAAIASFLAKKGVFAGGMGYAPVDGTEGHILAGIFVTSTGEKLLKVLLQGENGEFLPPIEIVNADFVMACQYNFQLPEKDNLFYSDIKRFQKNTIRAILDRLPYTVDMDFKGVLEALKVSYRQLPVNQFIADRASIGTIYRAIVRYVMEHRNNDTCTVCEAYFRVQSCEMERIAESLEMSVRDVCKQLKEQGLLYLTPSPVAYQTKVRVNGIPISCYCIRKPRQREIDEAAQLALPTTTMEDGVVVLNDGRVELTRQKYAELFGEKAACHNGNSALQSTPQGETEG